MTSSEPLRKTPSRPIPKTAEPTPSRPCTPHPQNPLRTPAAADAARANPAPSRPGSPHSVAQSERQQPTLREPFGRNSNPTSRRPIPRTADPNPDPSKKPAFAEPTPNASSSSESPREGNGAHSEPFWISGLRHRVAAVQKSNGFPVGHGVMAHAKEFHPPPVARKEAADRSSVRNPRPMEPIPRFFL